MVVYLFVLVYRNLSVYRGSNKLVYFQKIVFVGAISEYDSQFPIA